MISILIMGWKKQLPIVATALALATLGACKGTAPVAEVESVVAPNAEAASTHKVATVPPGGDRATAMSIDSPAASRAFPFSANAPTVQQTDQSADRRFVPGEHFGALVAQSTLKDVVSIYGARNITLIDIDLGDGRKETGTAVYKGTADEFQILWTNTSDHSCIRSIVIQGKNWQGPSGLRVGSTLTDLNRMNARAFEFYGSADPFAGTVADWSDGKLSDYGSALSVQLQPLAKSFTAGLDDAAKINSVTDISRDPDKVQTARIVVGLR